VNLLSNMHLNAAQNKFSNSYTKIRRQILIWLLTVQFFHALWKKIAQVYTFHLTDPLHIFFKGF